MPYIPSTIILLIVSPVLMFLIHGVLNRVYSAWNPQVSATWAVLLSHIPVGALLWRTVLAPLEGFERWTTLLYAILVYESLAGFYFNFINMGESARRVHILHLLTAGKARTRADLRTRYGKMHQVHVRLQRLVAMGQLFFQDGRYRIRGRFLLTIARAVRMWTRLLGLPSW